MKRIVAIFLIAILLVSVGVIFVRAEENTEVYVTITDKDGKLALAYEKVSVTDIDGDSTLTINDVLYAAHEQFYEGGAAAGYGTETTKWGLSLMKLWGTANGGSYGYLVNDAMAWSLTDPVKDGDYVAAFIYTDTKTFTDTYSFFDVKTAELSESAELTLTLSVNGYEDDGQGNWLPALNPVPNAELTIDGEPTGVMTDADGKATITFDKNGKFLVSATSTNLLLIPSVCLVTVSCFEEATPDEADPTEDPTEIDEATEAPKETVAPTTATKDEATKDSATKDSTNPKTGDATMLWLWILIVGVCLGGIVVAVVIYKKKYAKK